MTNEKTAEAKKLRIEGRTYKEIGSVLGVAPMTIYYDLNPEAREKAHLYGKQYRINHREKLHIRHKQYCQDHKEERNAYGRQYYADHKEEHRERRKEAVRRYRKEHREETRLYNAEYRQIHKSEIVANNAKRRSLIAEATIGDIDQIKEIYRIAWEEPKVRCYLCLKLIPMGERQVDHIFPVSKGGPFRPSTLAVTHRKCNREKSDKTPEEIGLLL